MSKLILKVDKYSDSSGFNALTGAVVELRRIRDEDGGKIQLEKGKGLGRENFFQMTVQAISEKEVDLAPGRWFVTATFPNGEIISDEVELKDSADASLTLRSEYRSRHEWLAIHTLVGNIEGETSSAKDNARARTYAERFRFEKGGSVGVEQPIVTLTRIQSKDAWKIGTHDGEILLDPVPYEDAIKENLFPYEIRNQVPYEWRQSWSDKDASIILMLIRWRGDRFTLRLPWPWGDGRGSSAIQILLRIDSVSGASKLGVAVEDESFAGIAGLMTLATVPKAAVAVRFSQDFLFDEADARNASAALFEKKRNPISAAAGGYVLLATLSSLEPMPWHKWIDNLDSWFPSMPDGAILAGALRLKLARSTESLDEARDAFLRAYARGLPLFSAGLLHLLNGLTVFAENDPDIDKKMKQVRKFAQRIDTSQAFTVLKLQRAEEMTIEPPPPRRVMVR